VENLRWRENAIQALQSATEIMAIAMFKHGNECSNHAKRKTLMPEDLFLLFKNAKMKLPKCLEDFEKQYGPTDE